MPDADWSFEVVRTIPGTIWLVLKQQRHEEPHLLPHLQTGVSKVLETMNQKRIKTRQIKILTNYYYMSDGRENPQKEIDLNG